MLEHQNTEASHMLVGTEARFSQSPAVGPSPIPVLGYFPEQLKFGRDPIGYFTKLYRDYGVTSAWGGDKPFLVFSFDPDLNQLLSSADGFDWAPKGQKPSEPSGLEILSNSMLRMNGEEYKQRRRMILPAFHQSLIEHWQQKMVALTRQSLDSWRDGQEVNLHKEMHRLVASISMSVVLNIEDPAVVKYLDKLMYGLYATSTKLTTYLLPFDVPGSAYRRRMRTAEEIVTFLKDLIRQGGGTNSMLAMLIASKDENGNSLSETEVVGEVYNLMNFDNLISVLTYTLLMLAQHPRVHADTLDELQSVLRGGEPTLEHLGRLTLLDRVIKETLRLFPPFAFGRRYTIKEGPFGRFDLRAGVKIFFSPYITHRLPDIYHEPNRFLPERWETIKPSPYEYLPFGAGSHFCLGMRFAMLELKVALAAIIQRYRLEVIPGTRVDRAVRLVMETRQGVQMRINRQDRKFARNPISGNIHEMVTFG